jgi:hypothetical protein
MPRKSTVVLHRGHIAVIIPKQSAKKIDLKAGDSVKVALNSMNSVMVEKVACLPK